MDIKFKEILDGLSDKPLRSRLSLTANSVAAVGRTMKSLTF
jgi:hypothetical protein